MRQTLDEQMRDALDAVGDAGNGEPTSDADRLDRLDRQRTIDAITFAPTDKDHHGIRADFMRSQGIIGASKDLHRWSNQNLLDYCRERGIEPVFQPGGESQQGSGKGGAAKSPDGDGQPQPGDDGESEGGAGQDGEGQSDQQQPDDDRIRRIAKEVFHEELATEPVEARIVGVLGEYLPEILPDVVRLTAEEVEKHLPAAGATGGRIEIAVGDAEPVELSAEQPMHRLLPEALMYAALRQPVLLVGPAGSGKSFLARQVADILRAARFAKTACSVGMSEGVLLGRLLPTGDAGRFEYHASEFLRCYEEGGVFLLDEVDAADANTLLVLNDALANATMSVPSRLEQPHAVRHADFVLFAAANTYGTGSDRLYVGRNQLDEAFLDRFRIAQLEVEYDRDLETRLCPDAELRTAFWRIRDVVLRNRMQRVVSTRALRDAYVLRARGLQSVDYCVEQLVKGWTKDERIKVGLPAESRRDLYRRSDIGRRRSA